MAIKVLEQNGVEITGIDAAAIQNAFAGSRSGVIQGALNECQIFVGAQSLSVAMNTGRLVICGVHVKIDYPLGWGFSSAPIANERYKIYAELRVISVSDITVSFGIKKASENLTQNPILKNEEGQYQIEIGRFTHTINNTVTDCVRTLDFVRGGAGGGEYIKVGDVTTETVEYGIPAEISIENEEVDGIPQTNFNFRLPQGSPIGLPSPYVQVQAYLETSQEIEPNTFYDFVQNPPTVLTISYQLDSIPSATLRHYMFQFVGHSLGTQLIITNPVRWVLGQVDPENLAGGMTYQVSIVNGVGIIVGVQSE